MHLTCLVDTARLSIVVTETISSRDGDNLPALRMAASTTSVYVFVRHHFGYFNFRKTRNSARSGSNW